MFAAAPQAPLSIVVSAAEEADESPGITISSISRSSGQKSSVQQLVALASRNLIDSLCHEIGALLMMEPPIDPVNPTSSADSPDPSSLSSLQVEGHEQVEGLGEGGGPKVVPTYQDLQDCWEVIEKEEPSAQHKVESPPTQTYPSSVDIGNSAPFVERQEGEFVFRWSPKEGEALSGVEGVREGILRAVQAWGGEVSNRGIGVSADPRESGLGLTLSALQSRPVLLLSVSSDSAGSVAVHCVVEGAVDPDEASLLETVRGNLLKGLSRELSRVDWRSAEKSSASTADGTVVEYRDLNSPLGEDDISPVESLGEEGEEPLPLFPVDDRASVDRAKQSFLQPQKDPGPAAAPSARRDPQVWEKARKVGLRLEQFEKKGLEESAAQQLQEMLDNSRTEGFLSVVKQYAREPEQVGGVGLGDVQTSGSQRGSLEDLFASGQKLSAATARDILEKDILSRPPMSPFEETAEDLRQPTTKLPMIQVDSPLARGRGGVDLFEGPTERYEPSAAGLAGLEDSSLYQRLMRSPEEEEEGEQAPDPLSVDSDTAKLDFLLMELERLPAEMHEQVLEGYRDLLLSDNVLFLLRRASSDADPSVPEGRRGLLRQLVEKSLSLQLQLAALLKSESLKHLQTIEDVCEVAVNFQQDELKFLERMEYLKPRFDTNLLSFLTHAIQEESSRIRRQQEQSSEWLQVLQIVQQGVLAEFAARYDQLLEPLLLMLRFEDPDIRTDLLRRFVRITPSMELPYLRELGLNLVARTHAEMHARGRVAQVGQEASGVADVLLEPGMRERLLQLESDLELYLSEEEVARRTAEFKAEVARQGQRVVVRHRNPVVQDEIETMTELQRRALKSLPVFDAGEEVE